MIDDRIGIVELPTRVREMIEQRIGLGRARRIVHARLPQEQHARIRHKLPVDKLDCRIIAAKSARQKLIARFKPREVCQSIVRRKIQKRFERGQTENQPEQKARESFQRKLRQIESAQSIKCKRRDQRKNWEYGKEQSRLQKQLGTRHTDEPEEIQDAGKEQRVADEIDLNRVGFVTAMENEQSQQRQEREQHRTNRRAKTLRTFDAEDGRLPRHKDQFHRRVCQAGPKATKPFGSKVVPVFAAKEKGIDRIAGENPVTQVPR